MAGGVWAVLKNAKHPLNAARYVAWVSESWYEYGGGIPARVNLTAAEVQDLLGRDRGESPEGSVTVADLKAALLQNSLGVVDEKVTGAKAKEYTDIIYRRGRRCTCPASSRWRRR